MPRAHISILEDTGHYAMIERPQAVRRLIMEFLGDAEITTR